MGGFRILERGGGELLYGYIAYIKDIALLLSNKYMFICGSCSLYFIGIINVGLVHTS